MKELNAVYRFGNYYDRETKKRILIEDGAIVKLKLSETDILEADPNLVPTKFADAKLKFDECQSFYWENPDARFWKLYETGQIFFFELTAGIRKRNQTEYFKFGFQLQLLEDLYLYNRKNEPDKARFFDCHCIVEKCLTEFEFFEPVYAKSMNDALTKTYELYFSMFGKSTANAFDRLYLPNSIKPIREKTVLIQKQPPVEFEEKPIKRKKK